MLAAPFVVLMGGPVLGYVVGGGVVDRDPRRSASASSATRAPAAPKAQVGLTFGALMGRAWILGIAILVVGLAGEREDGLMAALLALVAFTVYLATTLVLAPHGEEHAQLMSKTRKILLGAFGGYLLLTVLAFIVFGSAGPQRGLRARRTSSRSTRGSTFRARWTSTRPSCTSSCPGS